MSRDLPRSELGPGPPTAAKKQLVSVKDYGALNPLPCLVTIFRKSGGKSRSGGGKTDSDREDVLLHSVTTITSAVAEEVRFTAQGKRVVVGQLKFLIPSDYSGWFEVLSQDGRATRPIEAVRELSGLTAPSFVVRQRVSAYRQQAGDRSWAAEVVREGALLRSQELVDSLPQKTPSDSSGNADAVKGPFLRCLDASGGVLYLSLEVRGLFSPVACRSSIVGAHDIRSLLAKFRLPVLVRLIHDGDGSESGTESSSVRQHQQQLFPGACSSSSSRTQRIFRLVGKYSEDIAFALLLNNSKTSVGKDDDDDSNMLPLPANDKYLISKTETKNSNRQSAVSQVPADDEGMKSLRRQCEARISNFRNSIRPSVAHRRHWLISDKEFDLELVERNQLNSPADPSNAQKPLSFEEQQLFREIEELYADVRNPRHLASPPKPRQARQRHRRDPAETTKFPKTFKMASFSNGALVGNTFLFSRNPVFQGNVEKSNRKHTGAVKDDLDQLVPAMAGIRHGRKGGNDDGGGQAGNVKHPGAMGARSAAASRENLYEEVVALKPLNETGREQPRPMARGRLQNPKLEMTETPKNAETEQQNKNTKLQRTSSHHNGPGDKQTNGQRNPPGNRISTTAADNNNNNINRNEQPLHSVDRIEATGRVDVRDPGILLLSPQTESNDRTSYRIDKKGGATSALLRPKSYAGTPHADHQRMTSYFGHPSVTTPAPSSPPKRVKSFAEVNVLSQLPTGTELTVSPRQDQRLLSKSTTALNSPSSPLPPSAFNANFPANRTSADAFRPLGGAARRTGSRSTHAVNEETRPVPSPKYANPEMKTSKDSNNYSTAAHLKPERRLRIRSANDDSFPSYV